jgi:hypothetical protein
VSDAKYVGENPETTPRIQKFPHNCYTDMSCIDIMVPIGRIYSRAHLDAE